MSSSGKVTTVTSADIVDGTIQSADIGDGAVGTSELGPGVVTNEKIADLTIDGAAKLADGSVSTVKLAVTAATQVSSVVGATSSPSTSSGTLALIPEMTRTLTTSGGPVLVFFSGVFEGSASGQFIQVEMFIDTADYGFGSGWTVSASGHRSAVSLLFPITPSSGSHTFEVKWASFGGTAIAYSAWRSLSVLELKR